MEELESLQRKVNRLIRTAQSLSAERDRLKAQTASLEAMLTVKENRIQELLENLNKKRIAENIPLDNNVEKTALKEYLETLIEQIDQNIALIKK